jgi:hypothetical protein
VMSDQVTGFAPFAVASSTVYVALTTTCYPIAPTETTFMIASALTTIAT